MAFLCNRQIETQNEPPCLILMILFQHLYICNLYTFPRAIVISTIATSVPRLAARPLELYYLGNNSNSRYTSVYLKKILSPLHRYFKFATEYNINYVLACFPLYLFSS